MIRGDYRVPSRVKISDSCRELLGRILQVDVAKRITIPEILKHKWCVLSPCCFCLLLLAVSPREDYNLQLLLPTPSSGGHERLTSMVYEEPWLWGRVAQRKPSSTCRAVREDFGGV